MQQFRRHFEIEIIHPVAAWFGQKFVADAEQVFVILFKKGRANLDPFPVLVGNTEREIMRIVAAGQGNLAGGLRAVPDGDAGTENEGADGRLRLEGDFFDTKLARRAGQIADSAGSHFFPEAVVNCPPQRQIVTVRAAVLNQGKKAEFFGVLSRERVVRLSAVEFDIERGALPGCVHGQVIQVQFALRRLGRFEQEPIESAGPLQFLPGGRQVDLVFPPAIRLRHIQWRQPHALASTLCQPRHQRRDDRARRGAP